MKLCMMVVMVLCVACLSGGGGGGGGGAFPADWAGVWRASIVLALTQGAQTRTTTTTEAIPTAVTGLRWTWSREGACVLRWTLDGSRAVADTPQRCTLTGDGGTVTLNLRAGDATLTGAELAATLRWSVEGATGAELLETITARR